MFDLTGRRALVTGASGAIGGAIAEALHKAGATVGYVECDVKDQTGRLVARAASTCLKLQAPRPPTT